MLSKLPVAERLRLVASAVFSCGSSSRCSIDTQDNLETETQKKVAKGYPLTNTIFEDTRRGYLYQNDEVALVADLTQPQQLVDLLNLFFSYTAPAHEDFNKAVEDFKQRVPDLARGLVAKLVDAHENNPRFIKAFDGFFSLCKNSLTPNLSVAAVDEMLVQHLLTERLIRTIFLGARGVPYLLDGLVGCG